MANYVTAISCEIQTINILFPPLPVLYVYLPRGEGGGVGSVGEKLGFTILVKMMMMVLVMPTTIMVITIMIMLIS